MRLVRLPGSRTSERYPDAGIVAPAIRLDRETGLATAGEPRPTDLLIGRHRMAVTITAGDGRTLTARFDPEVEAPLIPEGADRDLVYALRLAWRDRPGPGHPPETEQRIARIVEEAAKLGGAATRLRVAQQLGKVDPLTGTEEQGQYKRDVAAAGGWEKGIMRQARAVQPPSE